MQYIIDDTPIIEADVLVKQPPLISSEVLVPIKTISHEEEPTVSPLQIVDYGNSSIECAFDVTTEQAEEVVKGVLCGTTNPPTFDNADYRLLHGQGSMDLAFAGLHFNTEYFLRPYALSNLGYKYGDVIAQRTKNNPIPDEYQLVEYLESDGRQRIILNYIPIENSELNISFIITGTGGYKWIIGSGNRNIAGGKQNLFGFGLVGNMLYSEYSGSNSSYVGLEIYKKYNVTFTHFGMCIDDVQVATFNHTFYFTGYSLWLFGLNNGDAQYDGYFIGRILDAKISDSQNNIQLYSVYRKSDRKPGMYDIVNHQFYTNQGTGEFTVGPDREWQAE